MLARFRYPSPLVCWVNDGEDERLRRLASLLLVAVASAAGKGEFVTPGVVRATLLYRKA